MARDPSPLFVERSAYRLRRKRDAVKLIVVLGTGLWLVPVLWPTGGEEGHAVVPMSRALLYVFGVWLILIVLSALLVRNLNPEQPHSPKQGGREENTK